MFRTVTDVTTAPIVVGVVEGDRSDDAARVGWDLAGRLGVGIEFVHGLGSGDGGTRAASTDLSKRLGQHLDALVGGAGGERPSDHLSVRAGKASTALIEATDTLGAGILVLGAHRRRGVFDLGSTAGAALGRVHCAVWSQPCRWQPVERILVPVDASEDSLSALDTAIRLARVYKASVTVLSVFVPPEFAYSPGDTNAPSYVVDQVREEMHLEFRTLTEDRDWGSVPHASLFVEGEPTAEILDVQDEVDLIVMATHGRSPVGDALLGGVARKILQASTKPVLAVRHPSRGPAAH